MFQYPSNVERSNAEFSVDNDAPPGAPRGHSIRSLLFPASCALILGALCLQVAAMDSTGRGVLLSAQATAGTAAMGKQRARAMAVEYFEQGQTYWEYGAGCASVAVAIFALSRKPTNARCVDASVVLLVLYIMLQFLIV